MRRRQGRPVGSPSGQVIDADGVIAKFGVPAESIPDWLALVGDSADGFPGLPGFGAKSAATLLGRYGHLENIPADADRLGRHGTRRGQVGRDARRPARECRAFKRLATVRTDAVVGTVDDWEWTGPTADFPAWCERFGWPRLADQAAALAAARTS